MSTQHTSESASEPSDMAVPPVAAPTGQAASELPAGCPTPLAWQDVLSEFRQQTESFQFPAPGGLTVRGCAMGQGPPLYFLNGLSATPEIFCLIVWLLREEFRCVLIEYPEEATSLSQLAESVCSAADGFGDPEFDLFATSFGSAVALEILTTKAARIRRAVLQGPVNGIRLSLLERIATKAAQHSLGRMRHVPFFRAALQNNHRLWFPPIDPTRWHFLTLDVGSVKIRTVATRLRMLDRLDRTDQLSGIDTPTLVISSEGEAARHREAAELFADRIPDAESERIPNSGHVPFVSHPHRLAKLIGPFLRDESTD